MFTDYVGERREARDQAVDRQFNCPPDLEVGRLSVSQVADIAALVAARPTAFAANQQLLALFAALPTPDDSEFWWAVHNITDSLDLHPGNLPGGVQLTMRHPTETALASRMLAALTTLPADARTKLAGLIGERLDLDGAPQRLGELWLQAVETAAFQAEIASRLPATAQDTSAFVRAWHRG